MTTIENHKMFTNISQKKERTNTTFILQFSGSYCEQEIVLIKLIPENFVNERTEMLNYKKTGSETKLCLETKLSLKIFNQLNLDILNQAKKIPLVLPSSSVKILDKGPLELWSDIQTNK